MPVRVAIVADDLTGAADTAVAFLAASMPAAVRWPDATIDAMLETGSGAVAFDTRSRGTDDVAARSVTRAVVAACSRADVPVLYKKIDSLLRGHVAAEVAAALSAAEPGGLAVVAPAFPATGRTTIDGRVLVDGRVAAGRPSLVDLFVSAGFEVRLANRASVRGNGLSALLGVPPGDFRPVALLCDAETEADLAAVVRAGRRVDRPVLWVGSGGLARALSKQLGGSALPSPRARTVVRGPVLAVVGSMTGMALTQAAALVKAGVTHASWSSRGGANHAVAAVAAALDCGQHVLVTPDRGTGEGEGDPQVVAMIGRALAPLAPRVGALLLTGGDTALGVLRAWDCIGLDLVEEIEPGVVLSMSAGAYVLPVVTKSGSFGGPETLARALAVLEGLQLL